MPNYKELYSILFNAITDAVEELEALRPLAARNILVAAQQEAEEKFMEE